MNNDVTVEVRGKQLAAEAEFLKKESELNSARAMTIGGKRQKHRYPMQ